MSSKTLIHDRPWDRYDLGSLLALKETSREKTKFGFLFRHYWIPATILTFHQSWQTVFADGRVERCECEIERKMAYCRSSECLWREKIRPVIGRSAGSATSELLCSYDCYEQTFWSARPTLFARPSADQKMEARRQALYCLPILCPPGPIPIGFSWYASVGEDHMNYRLDAEEHIGETSVLVVRRQGRYTARLGDSAHSVSTAMELPAIARDGESKTIVAVVERQRKNCARNSRGIGILSMKSRMSSTQ